MQPSNRPTAMREKTKHRFVAGLGFLLVGEPPMPATVIGGAEACEPPVLAMPGTRHVLQPPMGAAPQTLSWDPAGRLWAPPLGLGKRLAFRSIYLAAHGWTYLGPA